MLHLYYGSDGITVRKKALEVAQDKDYPVVRFEAETYVSGALQDISSSLSLFGDITTYIIDTPLSNPIMWEELLAVAHHLHDSKQLYIVVDGVLSASLLKKISPYLDEVASYAKSKETNFNIFLIAEALAMREKKTLWILFTEALRQSISAEELIGILWWQLKSLRVAAVTMSAHEAGMKEYSYNKAKRALKQFTEGELEQLTKSLLSVYHQGHSGEKDIWIGLEEWVLRI